MDFGIVLSVCYFFMFHFIFGNENLEIDKIYFFIGKSCILFCGKVILNCRNAKHWKYQCFHVVFIKCLTNPLNNEYRFVALCELSLDIDYLCQYICFYKWNTFDHCNPMRTCQLEMYSGVSNRFASLNILYIEQFFSFLHCTIYM